MKLVLGSRGPIGPTTPYVVTSLYTAGHLKAGCYRKKRLAGSKQLVGSLASALEDSTWSWWASVRVICTQVTNVQVGVSGGCFSLLGLGPPRYPLPGPDWQQGGVYVVVDSGESVYITSPKHSLVHSQCCGYTTVSAVNTVYPLSISGVRREYMTLFGNRSVSFRHNRLVSSRGAPAQINPQSSGLLTTQTSNYDAESGSKPRLTTRVDSNRRA